MDVIPYHVVSVTPSNASSIPFLLPNQATSSTLSSRDETVTLRKSCRLARRLYGFEPLIKGAGRLEESVAEMLSGVMVGSVNYRSCGVVALVSSRDSVPGIE